MLVIGRNNFNEDIKKTVMEEFRSRIEESWGRLEPRVAINVSLLGTTVLDVVRKDFTDWICKEVEKEFESRGVEIQCIIGYEILRNTPSIYIAVKDALVIGNEQTK